MFKGASSGTVCNGPLQAQIGNSFTFRDEVGGESVAEQNSCHQQHPHTPSATGKSVAARRVVVGSARSRCSRCQAARDRESGCFRLSRAVGGRLALPHEGQVRGRRVHHPPWLARLGAGVSLHRRTGWNSPVLGDGRRAQAVIDIGTKIWFYDLTFTIRCSGQAVARGWRSSTQRVAFWHLWQPPSSSKSRQSSQVRQSTVHRDFVDEHDGIQ